MDLNIGPEYYVDSNTSLVLVDSKKINAGATAVVYISSVSIPGRIVSIKDSAGFLDTNRFITISACKDVVFQRNISSTYNNESSFQFNTPFGYTTFTNVDLYTWNLKTSYSYPLTSNFTTQINAGEIHVSSIVADTIQAQTYTVNSYVDYQISTISTLYVSSINNILFTPPDLTNVTVSSITFLATPPDTSYQVFGEAAFVSGYVLVTTPRVKTDSIVITQRKTGGEGKGNGFIVVEKNNGSFSAQSIDAQGDNNTGDSGIFDYLIFNPAF